MPKSSTPRKAKPQVTPFDELYRPHRYKVFYGGRGGGKSEAIAEALLFFSAVTQLRILCCREIQNSIADSSYATLKAVAYRLGIAADFDFAKTQITHKQTGSQFVFKGLLRNADSVRSMYGIDIVWVEEAVTVSEQSWQILIPTIRANKSEVWLSFNPDNEDDPTYQRFVVNPPPNAYVRKVNFDENPFFPEALRLEMEHDKATDYEKYLYIWEGFPRTISDAQIFKGKFVVEQFPDDYASKAERLFFGADFGFGQDPSTLIRCFILDNRLYIDYEAYGHHVELNELPELYRSVPGLEKGIIKADNSRPETISYLANRKGLRIEAAKKWQGSVEDGIAYLKSFDKIVVHPRCQHTIDELRLYSYKVDPRTAEVLPIIVDKYNHCLPNGTQVALADGSFKPIESVAIGDEVKTRYGSKKVLWSGLTDRMREIIAIRTDKHELKCTPDHRVYVIGKGFIEANEIQIGDEVLGDAPEAVRSVKAVGIASEVYDLTIADEHEFFANGVLVHNCTDALRYALDGYITKPGMEKWAKLGRQSETTQGAFLTDF